MENDVLKNDESGLLDELDELDKAIIKYKLDGFKNTQIAEKTGKHQNTIIVRLKKVKVQQAIDELQKTALRILVDTQSEAARELRKIVRNPNARDQDKINACKEVLKGVLSDRITIDAGVEKKIKEYLDEDDFDHIVEEAEYNE